MLLLTRIILCLVVVGLPAVGHAQAEEAPLESPVAAPVQDELIPRRHLPSTQADDLFVPRLAAGLLGGTLLGAGGLLVGAIVGLGWGNCSFGHAGGCSNPVGLISPPVLGVWLSSSLAVYGLGDMLRGHGKFLFTLAGGMAGTLLSVLPTAAFSPLGILAAPVLATVGALTLYELSHARWLREQAAAMRIRADVSVMPVLSRTASGSVVAGLAGCF